MDIHMKKTQAFRANPIVGSAAFLDERVLLNKAVLDVVALDAPQVVSANNPVERRERFSKSAISFALGYISPFVTLPLSSRLVMSRVVKLSKGFSSKENKLIRLSYKYLTDKLETQKGIELLSKELKTDFSSVINRYNGDYEQIRKKLINAKNGILGFDLLFTSGSIGSIGFYNNWRTKKLTSQDGFSAEFNMADRETVEKRAKKYKKSEPLRKGIFVGLLGLLTAFPVVLKKGLNAPASSKFHKIVKNISPKFDYTDGIFMKRLPFFMAAIGLYSGIALASRNQTELKDNITRSTVSMITFFGGDLAIGSLLASASDKFLKTDIIDKNAKKNFINKILPPVKPIKDLKGRSKTIGAGLFWLNLGMLAGIIGYGMPHLMNRMIKNDVKKELNNSKQTAGTQFITSPAVFKEFKLNY